MRVKNLPWNFIRTSVYTVRRIFGTKELPEREHLIVEHPADEIEDLFRSEHFRTGWFLSYRYEGEDGNYCRAELGEEGEKHMQVHVRAFNKSSDGCAVYAHYETDPVEHPRTHLNEENHSIEEGMEKVKEILDRHDITYTGNS